MMIRVIRMTIVIIMMVIVSLARSVPMFHKFLISRGQNGEEEVESTSLGPGDMPTGKDITHEQHLNTYSGWIFSTNQ